MGLNIFFPRKSYSTGVGQVNRNFGAFTIELPNVNCGSEHFTIPYFGTAWPNNDTAAVAVNIYDRGAKRSIYSGGSATQVWMAWTSGDDAASNLWW